MSTMKRITFYGYAENCNCTYCASLRTIMEHEKKLKINSFKLEEDNNVSIPQSNANDSTRNKNV